MSDVSFAFIDCLYEAARSVMLRVYTHIFSKKLLLDKDKSAFEVSNALKPSRQEGDDFLLSEDI